MYIPFSRPTIIGTEQEYILQAMDSAKLSGDGEWTNRTSQTLNRITGAKKSLLTPSGTHAIEMAARLYDIGPGDEVIMPSFTFVSTANAFAMLGAKIVFVDVEPTTMCVTPELVAQAITANTKAIVAVHYAGIPHRTNEIRKLTDSRGILFFEDAAQSLGSYVDSRHAGTDAPLAALSFHDTKNVTSGGEGGALLINDESFIEKAQIIREKGTNRSQFQEGLVDKYTWVAIGSSYLLPEINAAFLYAQLEVLEDITARRRDVHQYYSTELEELREAGLIELSKPSASEHNGHLFYIKLRSKEKRSQFIAYMKANGVITPFHYVPLHSAPCGMEHGVFHGSDIVTSRDASRLVRLPIFHSISELQQQRIVELTKSFFGHE